MPLPSPEGTVTWIYSNPAPREKHTTPAALFAEVALRATEQSSGEERLGRLGGGRRVCTPSRACAVPASVPASEGKEEEKGKREKEKEKRKREKEKERKKKNSGLWCRERQSNIFSGIRKDTQMHCL